ncbi:MAG: hypothetical protein ABI658_08425 [Acidimicrobiales bacterium]
MSTNGPATLLFLQSGNQALSVHARIHIQDDTHERWPEPMFDVEFVADAHPFHGTLTQMFTASELTFLRHNIARLTEPDVIGGGIAFGGEGMVQFDLSFKAQVVGQPDRWIVDAALAPSDDPPVLRWRLVDQPPFLNGLIGAIDDLLGST